MIKQKKYIPIIIFILAFACCPACVFYERDIHENFEHENRVMDNVILKVWNNATIKKCRPSFFCPIIMQCTKKGPIAIGLRATDTDGVARRLKIHKAVVIENNQKLTNLTLTNPYQSGEDSWFQFHDNAGEWIVHVSDDKKRLNLNEEFVIQVEVSLEKNGKIKKETIVFPMKKVKKIREGWMAIDSWIGEPRIRTIKR